MPIRFETQMNMNSENTSGKNFMPSEPAVLDRMLGHEFVAELGDRLDAARNQLPSGGAADHQQRDHRHRKEHVGRRIGEGDFLSADMADGEELGDVELMDRIDRPCVSRSIGFAISAPDRIERCASSASEPFGLLRHHARRPHHIDHAGDEAKQQEHDEAQGRSRQQAIETPAKRRSDKNTRDQLGGEAEARRPWRMPWPAPCPARFRTGQSRSFGCPEFWTTGDPDFRALRKAQLRRRTIDRDFHFRCHSCLQPCCGDPKRACVDGNDAPSPSKAARTILTASNQVKIAS